jgi:diguanylate cyclase (GGDEF)-like protein/PAS domain S-box-containing protein
MVAPPRILIVEDERIVAADLAAVLRQLGYEVTGMAASADQALALVEADRPDLALMDIRIRGDRDGIDVAGVLRARFRIPVVFVSAFADDVTIERARQTQPFGYLVKPFSDRELRSAIEVALNHHELESRLEVILANVEDGVALLGADRQLVLVNPAYCALFGLAPEHTPGMSRDEFIAHMSRCLRDPDESLVRLRALTEESDATSARFELVWPRRRILRRTVKPVRAGRGEGFLVVWHDETDAVDLIAERERFAVTDALTGVANRHGAEVALATTLAAAARAGQPLSVAIIDVDHFKQVNDRHGHGVGDVVLRQIAGVLIGEARGSDTIVRWGGEEFVALLPGTIEGAVAFCERVRAVVETLSTPAGALTVSAGVSLFAPGASLDAAVARADVQLYEAKRAGRNRVCAAGAA